MYRYEMCWARSMHLKLLTRPLYLIHNIVFAKSKIVFETISPSTQINDPFVPVNHTRILSAFLTVIVAH